jgi:ribosomal protein S18 acetylase RimI-like enzyme
MDCCVRQIEPGDRASVVALLHATPEFEPAEIPVAEEVLDGSLENPAADYQTLVAEQNGAFAGYICFGQTALTESAWDIYWMAVDRQFRGRGIGGRLLAVSEAHIKKCGGTLILIETSSKPNYLPTRRFYRKMGYKQVARIRDFYAPGDHRIIFEKRL